MTYGGGMVHDATHFALTLLVVGGVLLALYVAGDLVRCAWSRRGYRHGGARPLPRRWVLVRYANGVAQRAVCAEASMAARSSARSHRHARVPARGTR